MTSPDMDAVAAEILRQAASADQQAEKIVIGTVFNGPVSINGNLVISSD